MNFNRRGDITEILMTYGWVVLVVVVAIFTVSFFWLSPGRLVASSCAMGAPFYCTGAVVDVSGGVVSIELKNDGGDNYDISNVSISGCVGGSNSSVGEISTYNSKVVEIPCSGLNLDTTFKGDVSVSYKKLGSNLDQVATGRVIQRL